MPRASSNWWRPTSERSAPEACATLLDRLNLDEEDAAWIEGLPAPPQEIWVHAARLLAHRAAAVGLSRDLLSLDPAGSDADSPFFTLTRAVRERGERPRDPEARLAWEHCRAECCRALDQAHDRIEDSGVSTDLVFRLELLGAQLDRIAQLLMFVSGDGDGGAFTAELVRGSASQHGLMSLLRTAVKRLARKVVEHTGDTGEHYIARNHREWWAMAWSAAGGGALTAGTALFKYGLLALPLAPLLLGASLMANYTLSFCFMQLLGFSLASKQPAMTAAALASASLWSEGTLLWPDLLWGLLGIALIGIMNFAVSFALALWTALRARDLSDRNRRRPGWGILKAFNRSPGRFLFAPKAGATLDSPHPGDPHA